MKILLVQDTDWITRNPIQHNHLLERMVARGHEVRIIDYEILWREDGKKGLISRRQTFNVARILPGAHHTVIRPGILKVPLLDYASMLFTYRGEITRQITQFKPDVVIGDGVLTPNLAFGIAKKNKVKTIYYCIDVDFRLIPFRFIQPLGKAMESRNIKTAELVISINETLRDYTIKMGARRENTTVIGAGVDFNQFTPWLSGQQIRAKYGFRETDKVLLFVGWIYHFAGLKEAVTELAKIDDKSLRLLVVGDGDAYTEIDDLRKRNGLGDRVVMAGKQPYDLVPRFIAAADVCLLPFYNNEITRDIVPIKMYEYMAMGKPVVVTRLGGIYREFGEGNGVVYVDEPKDAVTKALRLLNEGQAAGVGKQAGAFVAELTWDKITDEFESVLRNLVGLK